MRRFGFWFASLFLVGLAAPIANAGVITAYSSRSAFEAAMGGPLTVEDFGTINAYPIASGILDSTSHFTAGNGGVIHSGDIKPGVTYSTPVGVGNFFNLTLGLGFSGALLEGQGVTLTVTFDSPAKGFGFDTTRFMGTGFTATYHFTSASGLAGYSETFTVTQGGVNEFPSSFFGFVSGGANIASVEIRGAGGTRSFALDNFTFGAPTASVPEPSSAILTGAGAVMVALAARRKPAN